MNTDREAAVARATSVIRSIYSEIDSGRTSLIDDEVAQLIRRAIQIGHIDPGACHSGLLASFVSNGHARRASETLVAELGIEFEFAFHAVCDAFERLLPARDTGHWTSTPSALV